MRMRSAFSAAWPMLAIAAALAAPADAAAAPRLHCHIEQGGTVQDLQFGVVSDPYTVPSIAINNRFRFKAVMVGEGQQVAYIKLYTYYQTKRQAVLLQEAKYLAPQVQAGADPAGLTGIVYLYSPLLGREIQYGCALREEAA
jgi:hypothetical protein